MMSIGRARSADTLLRIDKRREPDDPETDVAGVLRRVDRGCFVFELDTELLLPSLCQVPVGVPSVVDMAADMDIEALLEKQVGELGTFMTPLGQTEITRG